VGAIHDRIKSISARGLIRGPEIDSRIGRVKSDALVSALRRSWGADRSITIELPGSRVVKVSNIVKGLGWVRVNIEWAKNGEPQPFHKPWTIINPPASVADPSGEIIVEWTDHRTNETITRRYRDDPMAAFIQMLDRRLY
jgi:hypothetical protein